jgi:hypothetical protein
LITFFPHIQKSAKRHFNNLTPSDIGRFSFRSAYQFPLILAWFLLFISCQKSEEPVPPISGPIQLLAIERSICPGMQVQFHLHNQVTGDEIDFAEYTFDPIPNGLGEISPNGLYKAPELISAQTVLEITVKWKPNPNVRTSHTLFLSPNSESDVISKIPHAVQFGNKFYGLSASNEFLFGSPFIGTGPAKTLGFEVAVVDPEGQMKWGHNLGIGQTSFGAFFNDHVLISGWVMGMEGSPIGISKIYDAAGNDLDTEVQKQMRFMDDFMDVSGNLYLSNSAKSNYTNPTQIVKLSPGFDILQSYSLDFPVYSFLVNQDESVIAFYSDEFQEESGIVMVDQLGQELWHIPLPYLYPHVGKLVQINDQKYGLVRSECKLTPCALEMVYYEFGGNGELIIPGQTIVNGITLDILVNGPLIEQQYFYIEDNILDVLVVEEEVLVVFRASTRHNQALMIKGTKGASLEYWWDPKMPSQTPLGHIQLKPTNDGLEWKTFCGQAICTFQLDKNLAFDSCF